MELTIEGQKREAGSKPKAIRRSGRIPAVVYGYNGAESTALTLDTNTAEKMLEKVSLNNTLIQLNIPDVPWSGKALLREVQSHPWKGSLYHLSFFAVSAQDSLEVEVPLHSVGEAVGVKQDGGMLDFVLTELTVRCAPDSIPESIEIDVSGLNIGDSLRVGQIVLPPGITALADPEQTVVILLAPRISDEGATTEAGTAAQAS